MGRVYCDLKRLCRFTCAGWRKDSGKRIIRTRPYQYETLNLAPFRMWLRVLVGRCPQRRFEVRIAANETMPFLEYLGTDREYLCNYCLVRALGTRMNRGNDSTACYINWS